MIICFPGIVHAGEVDNSEGNAEVTQVIVADSVEQLAAESIVSDDIKDGSLFSAQRLRLVADRVEEIEAYGAIKAVYYDDHYLLSYDSEEATEKAYALLLDEYGDHSVYIDIPLKAEGDAGIDNWGSAYMGMRQEKTREDAGDIVTIAVIDTGIKADHNVFSGAKIVDGYDFINGDKDPEDENGHGTAVAGIIAGSVPSNVRIMPLKTLDASGNGYLEDTLNAIEYAENNGADIINLSLGDYVGDGVLERYEELFSEYEPLIICAAGNGNVDLDEEGENHFPGELSSVVSVGAINSAGKAWSKSNYGSAVDFAAPGSSVAVASIDKRDSFTVGSGTSYAAPHVSAAAALVKSRNSELSNSELIDILANRTIDLGAEGRDVHFGYGCPYFSDIEDNTSDFLISGFISNKTYTGSKIRQDATVISCGALLKEGFDYTTEYKNNLNAESAAISYKGIGSYEGKSRDLGLVIGKAENTLKASGKTISVKQSALRSKAKYIKRSEAIKISGASGTLRYIKVSGSKKISINSVTGKIKISKKTAKGKYKIKVKVNDAGDDNHFATQKYVIITVKVK